MDKEKLEVGELVRTPTGVLALIESCHKLPGQAWKYVVDGVVYTREDIQLPDTDEQAEHDCPLCQLLNGSVR